MWEDKANEGGSSYTLRMSQDRTNLDRMWINMVLNYFSCWCISCIPRHFTKVLCCKPYSISPYYKLWEGWLYDVCVMYSRPSVPLGSILVENIHIWLQAYAVLEDVQQTGFLTLSIINFKTIIILLLIVLYCLLQWIWRLNWWVARWNDAT